MMKGYRCSAAAFIPLSLRRRGNAAHSFPPPGEGGVRGGGPNTFDPPKFFARRTQPRPFPLHVNGEGTGARLGAINNRGVRGRALRLAPAPRRVTDEPETRTGCQRRASPPPLAPPSQGGERNGERLLGVQSCATKALPSQSRFRSSHHQLCITQPRPPELAQVRFVRPGQLRTVSRSRAATFAMLPGRVLERPSRLGLLARVALGPDLGQKRHEAGRGRRCLGDGSLDRYLKHL